MMNTATTSDNDIQRLVLAELAWDPRVEPHEIGVAVNEHVVTLAGFVDSYTKRIAAEEAAHRVHGVHAVVNELQVRLPEHAQPDDEELAQAVLRSLEWDTDIDEDAIEVTVAHGWVTLRGEVAWQHERQAAEYAASRLRGVQGVINRIEVRPHVDPTGIHHEIQDALIRGAETDADRIQVSVEGTKVTLTGQVVSRSEKNAAARAAWLAPGVTELDNQLEIEP
jgi:osmotically-inducible protein OsmY